MATKKLKDLAPKKNPKGSRLVGNHNHTLVRATSNRSR
jgi:hypothetical protein